MAHSRIDALHVTPAIGATIFQKKIIDVGSGGICSVYSTTRARLPLLLPRDSTTTFSGEVLKLLENWRGASFADENQQTGFGEPGKGAPHGNENTCFAAHA